MNDTVASQRINQAGLDLVKASEGFSPTNYLCPAGKPTIGYGHVILAGEQFSEPISQAAGEDLLRQDLAVAEAAVESLVTVILNENQFSALASFTFNLGAGNLRKSTLLKKLNAGDYDGAAGEFGRWVNANGKPLPGLVTRRRLEAELFQTPVSA